jgi:hypothetical protein
MAELMLHALMACTALKEMAHKLYVNVDLGIGMQYQQSAAEMTVQQMIGLELAGYAKMAAGLLENAYLTLTAACAKNVL